MDEKQILKGASDGKTLIVMQAFGLGDVIFCQTLAHRWIEQGYRIMWGVLPAFVEGLNRAYPRVTYFDYRLTRVNYNLKKEHFYFGARVIPLRWSDQICKVPFKDCMKSKYMMFNMNWEDWRQHAGWRRDHGRELELLKTINPEGRKFNIINRTFRSNNSGVVDIAVDNGHLNIEMKTIPGFSLFDWALAFETAEEIHTVSTSIIYVLEVLRLPAHLYVRRPDETSHAFYDYILSEKMYLH